jgi:hypothetical protein
MNRSKSHLELYSLESLLSQLRQFTPHYHVYLNLLAVHDLRSLGVWDSFFFVLTPESQLNFQFATLARRYTKRTLINYQIKAQRDHPKLISNIHDTPPT